MLCYQITNIITGKVYIGLTLLTVAERWSRHVEHAAGGRGYALHDAIRKYGVEAFVIEEIAAPINRDRESLADLERALIAQAGSVSPGGYNLTAGGDGVGGCEETNRKISASLTGKKLTQAHRASLSASAKTRKTREMTPELRASMSAAQKGKPKKKHTEETKAKLRAIRCQQLAAMKIAREAVEKAASKEEVSQ